MLIIIAIVIIAEGKSPDRAKYITSGLYILSSLLYNLFYSGAFINYFTSINWQDHLIVIAISITVLANLEFIQYNFNTKPNLFEQIMLGVNRIICIGCAIAFIIFLNNNYLYNIVCNDIFYNFVIISLTYGLYIIIKAAIKNMTSYVNYNGIYLFIIHDFCN